ncbi:MAG: Spy/CpxP family protein refolding chaperone [Desulfuromonadales bacterium]
MLSIIGGILLALGGSSKAVAMGFEHPGFGNMSSARKFSPQVRHFAKVLDLTLDQETQVQAIVTTQNLNAKSVKQKIASDYSNISAAAIVLPFDETAVTALANQLGDDVASLATSEAKAESKIFALLTPVQQALFEKIRNLFESLFE